eukprot:1157619-Pelagomonas_calceolata.AAC.36
MTGTNKWQGYESRSWGKYGKGAHAGVCHENKQMSRKVCHIKAKVCHIEGKAASKKASHVFFYQHRLHAGLSTNPGENVELHTSKHSSKQMTDLVLRVLGSSNGGGKVSVWGLDGNAVRATCSEKEHDHEMSCAQHEAPALPMAANLPPIYL